MNNIITPEMKQEFQDIIASFDYLPMDKELRDEVHIDVDKFLKRNNFHNITFWVGYDYLDNLIVVNPVSEYEVSFFKELTE